MSSRYISLALGGLIAAFSLPQAALAQSVPAKQQAATGELAEVTVTAQRYTSSLQTTPIAISAFTEESLQQQQITNVLEAAAQIPGVLMTPTTGATSGARIFMRGVGDENTAILFDPAVGVYIDNVYQPRINGQFFDFFDIDRLEVLRGPQGTLYGRNTNGGAIKIVTKSPSFEPTASGDIAYGTYNQADARIYLSGPLIGDKLAGSVSGVSRRRDGWTMDPNYDRPMNNKDQLGLRAKLLYKPNDDFSAELSYQFIKDRSDAGLGSPIQLFGAPSATFSDPKAVPGRDLFQSELSGTQFNRASIDGASLNLSYRANSNITVNSITGWGFQRVDLATPFTLTSGGGIVGTSYKFTDSFFSEEANVTAKYDRFKGVAGVFYFSETGHQWDGAPYTSLTANDIRKRKTDAQAVFAEGTFYITENVGLTGGLRYTSEKADFTQWYFNQLARTPAPQNANTTFSATTPKAGIDWQVLPNMMLYASYTKGFKSGGYNAVNPSTNVGGPPGTVAGPTAYFPEKVTSYEAGMKFTSPDRHLRVNLAIFQADYDGLQLPVFFPGTASSYTYNATGATVRGLEIEPTWQVTDSFQIYGMGSFEDDKYTKPFACSIYNTSIVADCSDRHLKAVIPTKTSLGFNFSPKLNIKGSLHLDVDWQHNSRYFNNVSNTLPIIATPSEDLFNASLRWDSEDGHWRVALEGKNISDNRYALESLQLANPAVPGITVYPNDPATFDVRVRFNF